MTEAWRERLVPKTLLSMVAVILAFSVGAAFSGVVLFSYYEFRKDQTEERVDELTGEFNDTFRNAIGAIQQEGETARVEVEKQLEPLRQLGATGETIAELIGTIRNAIFFVSTLDEAGAPSVGSAFVVASDARQSLLLTSYTTVRAATRQPGPAITVRQGDRQERVTLWTWQEEKDLALLVLPRGDVPRVEFAPRDPAPKLGERVFAVSGLGAAGGAVSQGFIADVSANAIQHDASVGPSFQGGPLVNSGGQVIAVASRSYTANLGFTTQDVYFAIPIRDACERVIRCPSADEVEGPGSRR